jgi:hypothetical protein
MLRTISQLAGPGEHRFRRTRYPHVFHFNSAEICLKALALLGEQVCDLCWAHVGKRYVYAVLLVNLAPFIVPGTALVLALLSLVWVIVCGALALERASFDIGRGGRFTSHCAQLFYQLEFIEL